MPIPSFSLRFDEHQLLELSARARVHGVRRGYLHKSDSKLKKLQQRWCCVFQNFLFYFESESCTKPIGVVFLEGTTCKPVDQIGMPIRDVEGAFCISSDGSAPGNFSSSKQFFFLARSDKEREEWMKCISSANMTRLLREVEESRLRCETLENKLATSTREVEHLKQEQLVAQDDITHLRASVTSSPKSSPRHRCHSCLCFSIPPNPFSPTDSIEDNVRRLQGYVRGWLIRRRWKKIVGQYVSSPCADPIKKRNQLIWKFVASEEDYVSQLTVLSEEYRHQFCIAACARRPPLTLQQCNDVFRNCDELLLFHQLFLRGLHSCIDKWPVVIFGDVLKLFVPLLTIYHKFVGNHSNALDVLVYLRSQPQAKQFLSSVQAKPAVEGMQLEDLLHTPLKRIYSYIQDLEELRAHTPTDHVDYTALHDTVAELEAVKKMVMDEVCMTEMTRAVLGIEHRIEGGCPELLDKEQTLVKEGVLQQLSDKTTSTLSRTLKLRTQQRYCFLFSKHLLVTSRVQKKPHDVYRLAKEGGVLPLARCHVFEHHSEEYPELYYRGIKIECSHGNEKESIVLLATSVNEKAQWMADISQCIENEKQNKVLECQSLGAPVELSSKFIRYSSLKTGKEQLVNSGNLDSLLQRLVKVNYFGMDFLNTFMMTFPLYTDSHTVLDFLIKSYHNIIEKRTQRRISSSPEDCVRDARTVKMELPRRSSTTSHKQLSISYPHAVNGTTAIVPQERCASTSAGSSSSNPNGIFFALKHLICKHFYHFANDKKLSEKVEELLSFALSCSVLISHEKSTVLEVQRLYLLQKEAEEEHSLIMELMNTQVHLPPKPFEVVHMWEPRDVAEQLCCIESTLFSRIGTNEILRHFKEKGEVKAKVAPNLNAIFDHFNRMSLFFMWTVASQRYQVDRTKVLEFFIQLAAECSQLNNFSSFMQIMSALEHGSVNRFKTAWDNVCKNLKQQFQSLTKLSNTDGRFKELREAMRKAHPPSIPYLGIPLSELSGVVEALPTYVEGGLVNFSKMRKCTRLITDVLQYQRDPYEYTFVPEISKILLCTPIPGDEDELYRFVDGIEDK